MALIEPFNDCSADDPRVGNANSSIVLAIDPVVRSRPLLVEVLVLLNVCPFAPSKLSLADDRKVFYEDAS